jgi:hypothetical protein
MMRIRIVSAGNGYLTQVLDCDGKVIKGITKISIEIKPNELATADLTFRNVSLDIEAQANIDQQDGTE